MLGSGLQCCLFLFCFLDTNVQRTVILGKNWRAGMGEPSIQAVVLLLDFQIGL